MYCLAPETYSVNIRNKSKSIKNLPAMKSGFLINQRTITMMKQIKTESSWHLMGPRPWYFAFITFKSWASLALWSIASSPEKIKLTLWFLRSPLELVQYLNFRLCIQTMATGKGKALINFFDISHQLINRADRNWVHM